MATISLCDRTSKQTSRLLVKEVNIKGNVSELRCKISTLVDVPVHEIELIYCGQCLQDGKTVDSYNLTTSATIHALRKKQCEQQDLVPEPMDSSAVQQVVTALQAALMNPAHRNTVESMMSRPETLENLIAATPGLDRDPVALAMLQDPELLAILADPDNIHKVIEVHPSLGHAAMLVAAAINEEGTKAGARSGSGSNRTTYSLDRMSDDEDMPGPSVSRQAAQPITASQLAAALAAAGSGGGSPSSQPADTASPASSSSSSVPPGGMISADFFQQAMMQATNPTTASSASTDAALQQLRDMGITDEARARRALDVTAGNIQAALELLFGDNEL